MSGWAAPPGPVLRMSGVGVTYPGAAAPTIHGIDLEVHEGELLLLVGRTGCGKSTLLGTINGLVPHFSGGRLSGRVLVSGRDTANHPPRELADVVGMVPQDPMSSFVTDSVEEELAYCMESLGLRPAVMRRRVEETLDLLGLSDVRERSMADLSGGQRQRVAIGAVLTAHPRLLVMDEPTSALDPAAAEEVLAAVQRLVHDLGLTVVLAEHRLERVVQYADRVAVLPENGGPLRVGGPAEMMLHSPVAPPVVQLGRLARWSPLPLSVRDARRRAAALRDRLDGTGALGRSAAGPPAASASGPPPRASAEVATLARHRPPPVLQATRLAVDYGRRPALRGVTVHARAGEVVALMGRNGAGKSTLLRAATGLVRPASGTILVDGVDPAGLSGTRLIRHVAMVPQDPGDLLVAETVAAELALADQQAARAPGSAAALLNDLAPTVRHDEHPRDLSEGQRLALALAVVLTTAPPALLLDEPTRGLDYAAKARLAAIVADLGRCGTAVVIATHDVELAAEVATRVIVLAEGEVVADGPAAEVVVGSPMFAPQVAKILGSTRWLTVDQVAAELAG